MGPLMLKLAHAKILCHHSINYRITVGWSFGLDPLQLLLKIQSISGI